MEFYIDGNSVWISTTNIPWDSCTVRANNWIAKWLGTPNIPNHETNAYYDYISYTSFTSGVKEILFDNKASNFTLGQNYPNPFNPNTRIPYYLYQTEPIKLVIYNLMGQRIRVLIDTTNSAGYHYIDWDGRDDKGQIVPAGVYIYRLQRKNLCEIKKMILLR